MAALESTLNLVLSYCSGLNVHNQEITCVMGKSKAFFVRQSQQNALPQDSSPSRIPAHTKVELPYQRRPVLRFRVMTLRLRGQRSRTKVP